MTVYVTRSGAGGAATETVFSTAREQFATMAHGYRGRVQARQQSTSRLTSLYEGFTDLMRLSRRLSGEYLQFMITNPIQAVFTTGALVGVSVIIFQFGIIGHTGRFLVSSSREVFRDIYRDSV